jgi:hypothetical protein
MPTPFKGKHCSVKPNTFMYKSKEIGTVSQGSMDCRACMARFADSHQPAPKAAPCSVGAEAEPGAGRAASDCTPVAAAAGAVASMAGAAAAAAAVEGSDCAETGPAQQDSIASFPSPQHSLHRTYNACPFPELRNLRKVLRRLA